MFPKRLVTFLAVLAINVLFLWLVLGPQGATFSAWWARLLLFAVATALTASALKLSAPQRHDFWLAGAAALINGAVYQLVGGVDTGLLRYVSTYPLSLGWSEGSRYYYASLFLAESVYGFSIPPSILHPSRYLMQAVPFLFPDLPLWAHRLWQILLFDATAFLTALALAWRLRRLSPDRRPTWPFVLFAFLFLFQGPVYYHLLVMAIAVLWGLRPRRFGLALLVVLLASAWAGISRVNWLPVPGLLAAAIYFLEVPVSSRSALHIVRYLLPPAVWTLFGTLTGYLSQVAYKLGSGNPPAYFDSSFSSDMLWYRLLPSVTYAGGVIANAIWVSLPLAAVILWGLWAARRQYVAWRWLALAAIVGILFLGGLVVSVKIGGGSNLHNLDAYLVLLLVVASYVFYRRFSVDFAAAQESVGARAWPTRVLPLLAVLVPAVFAISGGAPLPHYDFARAQEVIQAIQQQVDRTDGEVLFIRERQLLMFDEVKRVTLSPDYEVVFLMEMAMANNPAYLQAFRKDMARQRYALIVSDIPPTQFQGRSHQFGEENDAWVERVSFPLLCAYEPVVEFPDVNLVVLAPKRQSNCP
ncbi:MAG: hypothetical protein ACOYYS_03485 [Chloroflexota bacterium]